MELEQRESLDDQCILIKFFMVILSTMYRISNNYYKRIMNCIL